MAVLKVVLKRDLRKSILQGQPWIYKDNLAKTPKGITKSAFCKIYDLKDNMLGWGIYSPHSPIAIRVLTPSTTHPKSFNVYFADLFQKALAIRNSIFNTHTNCFRLFNGEGDLLPGLICDVYNQVAVIQFDGHDLYEFWDKELIANWLLSNTNCKTIYFKPRHDSDLSPITWGEPLTASTFEVLENNCKFLVDIVNGQKTGFFLDQRENRNYIKSIAKNKTVLNLFSYTGGFSIYAGIGEAQTVISVDIAKEALLLSEKNWQLNNLDSSHSTVTADVFNYLNTLEQKFDIIICDPPSLAKAENQKELAIEKYIELFTAAAKKVSPGGHLVLSSCSSHINFNDFENIAHSVLSKARKRGQILRFSGQGPDHPYPHACPQLRYLKFMDIVLNN